MADLTLTTLDFHGATLVALELPDGIFVAITPICDAISVDAEGQRQRIERDEVLAEGLRVLAMPSPRGIRDSFCLRLDLVHGWLLGIDASRVREEAREPLLAFKRECHQVLFRHFYSRARGGAEPSMRDKLLLVDRAERLFGKDAARAMWFDLGLRSTRDMRDAQRHLFAGNGK